MARRQGNICLQPYWCQTPIWNAKFDGVLMLTKRKTSARINLTAWKSLSEITSFLFFLSLHIHAMQIEPRMSLTLFSQLTQNNFHSIANFLTHKHTTLSRYTF